MAHNYHGYLIKLWRVARLWGVVLHEIAHLVTVLLLPNIKPTDISLTSHIQHKGKYTVTRSALISFAPFLTNTLAALACFYAALYYVSHPALQILTIVGGVVFASTAYPSYTDALLPFRIARRQLFSFRWPLIIVLFPIYSIPLTLIALFAWLRKKSLIAHHLFNIGYSLALFYSLHRFSLVCVPLVQVHTWHM
jgi:hypothetical protein